MQAIIESDFSTLGAHWIRACECRGLRPKTLAIYRQTIDLVRKYDLSRHGLEMFFLDLHEKGSGSKGKPNNSTTLSLYYRTLRIFFRWAVENGYLDSNLLKGIPEPRARNRIDAVLTEKEEQLCLNAITKHREDTRDRAILLLMIVTGIRPGELIGIEIKDVDLNLSQVTVFGKSQQFRTVPFTIKARKALISYLRKRKSTFRETHLFIGHRGEPLTVHTLQLLFRRISKETGIKRLVPYLLRHTFATRSLQDGASLEYVRRMLGHTTFAVTQRYSHMLVEDLAREQNRHPIDRNLK